MSMQDAERLSQTREVVKGEYVPYLDKLQRPHFIVLKFQAGQHTKPAAPSGFTTVGGVLRLAGKYEDHQLAWRAPSWPAHQLGKSGFNGARDRGTGQCRG
jgi:hypothetical protein